MEHLLPINIKLGYEAITQIIQANDDLDENTGYIKIGHFKNTGAFYLPHLIQVPRLRLLTGGIPGGIGGGSGLCPAADGGGYPPLKLGAIPNTDGGGASK